MKNEILKILYNSLSNKICLAEMLRGCRGNFPDVYGGGMVQL